jgi:RNA polymerase sigma-70 factor (ECF subfamily)
MQTQTEEQEARSTATFDELYASYATDVLRVCYFYLRDRFQAEDVCQDVFVKLLTTKPELRAGHEKSWLLKVAMNRCRDLWRSSWVKRVLLGTTELELVPGADEIRDLEEKQAIMQAVSHLRPDFREVVLLHYYGRFGITEIAGMLDIPEGTVSSRLSRARAKLGVELKGEIQ